mmetsp:Transcript_45974/g.132581  ORF Transcript_45974/g.132581 Transcript_45974/m.132581 type:complete len:202 (-) Transcript_45974:197-802(-)
MEIPRRRRLPRRADRRPSALSHAELVEVIHAMHTVVATEEVYGPLVRRPRWATAARGDKTLNVGSAPHAAFEIKVVRVVQPCRAIVATEDVHEVAMHRRDVPEASRRHNALLPEWHPGPLARVEVEGQKIIQPSKARVPAEEVHLAPVHDCTVVFTANRHISFCVNLRPTLGWEVEPEDVIQTAASPVAAEDIQCILVDDA